MKLFLSKVIYKLTHLLQKDFIIFIFLVTFFNFPEKRNAPIKNGVHKYEIWTASRLYLGKSCKIQWNFSKCKSA